MRMTLSLWNWETEWAGNGRGRLGIEKDDLSVRLMEFGGLASWTCPEEFG